MKEKEKRKERTHQKQKIRKDNKEEYNDMKSNI